MIHYTLLPEKEIKTLKKEYRTRLFVTIVFFVSCAIFIGIVSLLPSYIYSYTQQKAALEDLQALQDSRKERGTDTVMKELADAHLLTRRLENHKNGAEFSQAIAEIILRKTPQISLNSFLISTASSTLDVTMQGKALTRESLINFKKSLEQNPFISKIDLPISDLAKSKDISFALNLTIQTP